jgi:HEAT repeat protein
MKLDTCTVLLLLLPAFARAEDPCVTVSRGDASATEACVDASVKKLSNRQISAAAVETLDGIGAPAVPALIKALQSEDALTRASAADALGRIGRRGVRTDAVVSALVSRLKDREAAVRRQAAGALGRIGLDVGGASAALQQSLDDEDSLVRFLASDALGKLKKP